MKKSSIPLIVVCLPLLAGLVAFSLNSLFRRNGPAAAASPDASSPPPDPVALSAGPSATAGPAVLPAPPVAVRPDAEPQRDPWSERLIAAHRPDESNINFAALKQFDAWLSAHRSGSADAATSSDPIKLARIRRATLKELIKKDPEAALAEMLGEEDRGDLPPEILELLEVTVAGTGDWQVQSICFWDIDENSGAPSPGAGKPDFTYNPEGPLNEFREAVFDADTEKEIRYFGFPVGALVEANTETNIPLTGFAIDDVAVFDGAPPRRLEAGEALPAGVPINRVDPISGEPVALGNDDSSGNASLPEGVIAFQDRVGIQLFESEDHLHEHRSRAPLAESPAASEPPVEGEVPPVAAAPEDSTTGQMDALPFSVKTKTKSLGYRTLLYMRVAFADNPGGSPQTEASAYSNLRTANNHMIESSYGRMQMLTTVTPVLVLPEDEQFYKDEGTGKLATDAKAAASALGYKMADYSHRVYRYSGGPGTFGGLAAVGADPGNVWLRTSSAGVAVHEFGHNYGLSHSGFWNGSRKSSIGPGSNVEYGHSHDPMGSASLTNDQFCSYQKQRIGWLKGTEWIDSRTSGRYRIAPMDDDTVDPGKRYAIKIDKDGTRKYWLEYRRNFTTSAFTNGVLLQGEKFSGNNNKASLFDVTFWSKKEKNDAGIPLGWTFSDYEHGIHITPVARAGSRDWIDVQVNRGQFPGNQAPVLNLSSNKTTAATGENIVFTASATDADGDELAYHWYYDDNDFHRNQNKASPTKNWGTAGIYNVVCTVTDMKGGVSVKSIPVTVGSPSSQFTVTGNVNDHAGGGVRNAPVDNNLAQSNANYRSTITDDNGDYTLTRLVAGDYTFNCRLEGDLLNRSYSPVPLTVGSNASGVDFRAKRVSFSSSPGTLAENGGVATFTIGRVGSSTGQFDVAVSFSGAATLDSDFSVSPAPVGGVYTIPSGAGTELVITVTGLNDGVAEGLEDIILAMQPVNNLNLTGPTFASLTISDDDSTLPRLVLAPVNRVLDENGGTAQARITRYGDTTLPLTVGLNTGNTATYNTDYSFSHGAKNITIPAGESSAILTVQGIDDGDIEGREALNITMKNGSWIKDPVQKAALIYLADDDIPGIEVTAADSSTGEGNNSTGRIRFTASSVSTSDLDVAYCVRGTALHGTDYQQTSGILTIPAGQAFADVVINGLADTVSESGESAIVRAAAHNSDYTLGAGVEATVNVNNKPLLAIAAPPGQAAEFGPVSASCQISRVGDDNSGALVVTIALSGSAGPGSDFAHPGTTVTIPDGSPSIDVDIDPLSDTAAEGNESVILTLTPKNGYAVGPANQASVTIQDLPIDEWRVAKFGANANTAAIAGDLADPESDGTVNLLEFGLILEPMIVDVSQLPEPVAESGFLTITYTRRKNEGINYVVSWSSSLAEGTWTDVDVTEEILSEDADTEMVKAKIALDNERKFMRLEVSR